MNMKGMNAYQHFGLRQPWIEHFMADGVNCFGQGVLGNRQYDALKVWLRDAGIIESNKDKTISVTSLGEKLIQRGSYNPFVWAIIWANLAYNSTICRWYCLNTEIGATYEKGDLVVMIGEEYSKSTRDNAVTSLLETLRQSPIGSALQQGIPMELSKTTYSYYRAGWEYPMRLLCCMHFISTLSILAVRALLSLSWSMHTATRMQRESLLRISTALM